MQPSLDLITIADTETLILEFIDDLIIKPRVDIHKWSKITKQTPTLKIGYIGQHLASLILGMQGDRTGARGHDIVDGTEVKSCTKVDQVDKCKDCTGRVMRTETICPHCDSTEISRKDDSKWLFSIRTEEELTQITDTIERVFLLISDYPNFKDNDFSAIRFEAFEIHPQNQRMYIFRNLLTDYYYNNYKPKADANRTTAPMNFHPYKFQFYMTNPIKIFSCIIENVEDEPIIDIQKYVLPDVDRSTLPSEDMPTSVLNKKEILNFIENAPFDEVVEPLLQVELSKDELLKFVKVSSKDACLEILPAINEIGKQYLQLRDIVIGHNINTYRRN
jgi:RNA polymerase subunit RPABC4/transcription elongation factor Spt4